MCPRCEKSNINTIRVKHSKMYVNFQKCRICGFLFMSEEEEIKLTKETSKKMFLQEVLQIGKNKT